MTTHRWFVMAALTIALSTGCTNVKSGTAFSWPWEKKQESLYEIPTRMVVTWSYNILSVPGKKPAPGFGARIYFYNNKSQAIPVDGSLTVYAYDDTEVVEPGAPPTAKFAFTPSQFTSHFKETDMGASYSIWVPIPWHDSNGPPRSVSLIPVFTDVAGGRLVGKQSMNLLPGRKMKASNKFPTRFIRQPDGTLVPEVIDSSQGQGSLTNAIRKNSKLPSIRTTSIPLSDNLIRQSMSSGPGSGMLPQQARFLQRQLMLSTRALQKNAVNANVAAVSGQQGPQPGATLGIPVAQGIPVVPDQRGVQPASATQHGGAARSSATGGRQETFRVKGAHVSRPLVRRHR